MDPDKVERSLWAFDGITKTHAQALRAHVAEIVKVRKTAARLQAALDAERIERAAVEEKLRVMIAESDTADRVIARDVETLERHVEALDQNQAQTIRKSLAPRSTVAKTTPVRDEKTGRLTETVTVDPDRPGIAVIRRIIRDASYRVIGSETYEVPLEDETDEGSPAERRPGESEHEWRSTPHLESA